MKRYPLFSAIIIVFLFMPAKANACSQCVDSLLWTLYPPLLVWGYVGTAWFIALFIVSLRWKQKIPYIPSLWIGILLLTVMFFVWGAMFGALILLCFLVISFLSWISSLRRKWAPHSLRIAIQAVAFCALSSIIISTLLEIIHPTPRGPVDIVLRWEGTSQERMGFMQLRKMEPKSVDDYREIVKKARLYAVTTAAARLAEIGDPKVDVPLIIDALERQQQDSYPYIDDDLQKTLSKMTGVPVDKDRSAEEWRRSVRP